MHVVPQLMPLGADATVPVAVLCGSIATVSCSLSSANVALVFVGAAGTENWHGDVAVPSHGPPAGVVVQPTKCAPVCGFADSDTDVPYGYEALHCVLVALHEIVLSLLVTEPGPLVVTATRSLPSANVAVTLAAAVSVTVHCVPFVDVQPVQLDRLDPVAGVATSVTLVP